MAETPKRPIAASDDCLKKDKKRRLLKAQSTGGSQFACLTEVSTPYGHFYFRFVSSPFFRGHRFFGGFESTSSAKCFKVSYYAIDVNNNIIEYTITCAFT